MGNPKNPENASKSLVSEKKKRKEGKAKKGGEWSRKRHNFPGLHLGLRANLPCTTDKAIKSPNLGLKGTL